MRDSVKALCFVKAKVRGFFCFCQKTLKMAVPK